MRTTFFGLETARRALMAQQRALDITGHNVANANTPGYSRQVVRLSATDPFTVPSFNRPGVPGQIGTGVQIDEIIRMRDAFLDNQVRGETQTLGRWEIKRDQLSQIELIMNEPSDTGIRAAFDAFWRALQDLSKNPENGATRAVVIQKGVALTDVLTHTYLQLEQLRAEVNETVGVKVQQINTMAAQIAELNDKIARAKTVGDNANDLMDKRDLLLKDLSKIVNIGVTQNADGTVMVTLGSVPLVDGKEVQTLGTRSVADPVGLTGSVNEVYWPALGLVANITNGELQGLLEMRDSTTEGIPYYLNQLNTLVQEVVSEINLVHRSGFALDGVTTNLDFFVNTNPMDPNVTKYIVVNPLLVNDPSLIAAANNPASPGDGGNALEMAQLQDQTWAVLGNQSFNDFFTSIISHLGVDARKATDLAESQGALVGHLEDKAQSVAGVSLDEELTHMVEFQHGYNAAARVVTVMDEMIDTIINRMGIVGR